MTGFEPNDAGLLVSIARITNAAAQCPPCPDCNGHPALRVAPAGEGANPAELVWDIARLHEPTCPYVGRNNGEVYDLPLDGGV